MKSVLNPGKINLILIGLATLSIASCTVKPTTGSTTTGSATTGNTGVYTKHYNLSRTGVNPNESILTPANVTPKKFGKVGTLPVDAYVYAQPLYAPGVTINGAAHNVVYVATEGDSVYAFDADTLSTTPLWHVNYQNPTTGLTNLTNIDTNCTDIGPQVGITGTPVIDPTAGTIYFVTLTKQLLSNNEVIYQQQLHALDIATGKDRSNSPMTIEANDFDPLLSNQRPGLVLANGKVYIGFGSNCDQTPYVGLILAYNASTLALESEFTDTQMNATPSSGQGGFFLSGGAPAVDTSGNIFTSTGNGVFDGVDNFAGSVIKIQDSSSGMVLSDYFTPYDQAEMNDITNDLDVDSGGVLLFPDQTGAHPHEMFAMGKSGQLYLIDRDSMGHYNASDTTFSAIVQSFNMDGKSYDTGLENNYQDSDNHWGLFGTPAFFNGKLYISPVDTGIRAYTMSNGTLTTTPTDQTAFSFGWPGGTPVISANGTNDGILWYIDNSRSNACLATWLSGANAATAASCVNGAGNTVVTEAVLLAYDATNLAAGPLYNSAQSGYSTDVADPSVKHSEPTVANGKVFVATKVAIDVYGQIAGGR